MYIMKFIKCKMSYTVLLYVSMNWVSRNKPVSPAVVTSTGSTAHISTLHVPMWTSEEQEEPREVVDKKQSFRRKLVRSRLKLAGHME